MLSRLPGIVLGALVTVAGAVASGAQRPPPLPHDVELASAGPSLRVDGMRLETQALRSPRPLDELAADFARRWRPGADHGLVTDTIADGWRVLGRRVGARHESVQLRAGAGGTHGYVAVRELAHAPDRVPAAPFAWPGGARVLRTVAADEAAGHATQIVALVPRRPRAAALALAANVRRAGWTPADPADADATTAPTVQPRRWTRAREELWLVVVPHEDAAAVVVHHVGARRAGGRP